MRKILALFFAVVMILSVSIPAYATELAAPTFTVSAPTFPDAYIITEMTYATQNYDGTSGSLGSISATVFVEERYDIVEGELVVVESRLLSEEEVLAIGIENFEDFNSISSPRAASNTRGKLTITFAGTYSYVGDGVSCDLVGSADWTTGGLFNTSENIPATGEDFIGVTWSGGFTSTDYSISGTNHLGGSLTIYESDSVANSGRVEPEPAIVVYRQILRLRRNSGKQNRQTHMRAASQSCPHVCTKKTARWMSGSKEPDDTFIYQSFYINAVVRKGKAAV